MNRPPDMPLGVASTRDAPPRSSILQQAPSATNEDDSGIALNLVFIEWEKVFLNSMASTVAMDGIVCHSMI